MDILLYSLFTVFFITGLVIVMFLIGLMRGKNITVSIWYIIAFTGSLFSMINLPNWKGWGAILGLG